ncbi:MAG: SDR family oxidoreductase [Nanoarchaeota archaeon]|nr:SDR family oxidoreductase [Nanoarchaeota archaeon]
MVQNSLEGKVAIITGASKGLGFEIASELANKGAHVNLIARNEEILSKATEAITKNGGSATAYMGDITDMGRIKFIINEVYSKSGRLDFFVNNAGEWKLQTVGTPADELKAMRVLTRDAPTEITEYLVDRFRNEDNELRILNVASQAGWKFLPGNLGYGVGKRNLAVNMLELQGNMDELGIKKVKLYGVYPGTFETPGVIEAIKKGELQDATTIESVVETSIDLLNDETPSRHAYIGFIPGQGIIRKYLEFDPETYRTFPQLGDDEVVDRNFDPKSLVK